MAKYHITKKAVEDLSSIWEYTLKTWSESQADIYYRELKQTFEGIAERPTSYDREYVEIKVGLYGRRCNKHIVFYRLVENGDIEIIRILHERMNIEGRLAGNEWNR